MSVYVQLYQTKLQLKRISMLFLLAFFLSLRFINNGQNYGRQYQATSILKCIIHYHLFKIANQCKTNPSSE